MIPSGYGGQIWAVLWQSTLANSVIATLAYWLRIPLNGSSFFMPFEAMFMFAFIGVMSLIASSLMLFGFGFLSQNLSRWAALAAWTAVYFGYSRSSHNEMQELHRALSGASGFVYPLIAAALWWRSVGVR